MYPCSTALKGHNTACVVHPCRDVCGLAAGRCTHVQHVVSGLSVQGMRGNTRRKVLEKDELIHHIVEWWSIVQRLCTE